MEDRPQTTSSTGTCKIGSMEERPQPTSSTGTCKIGQWKTVLKQHLVQARVK